MVINKFIVDGKTYSQLTEITNYDKICLEIKFICLNKNIVQNFCIFQKNILVNLIILKILSKKN